MEEDVLILLGVAFNLNLPLLTAWLLDHWLGDPAWLPHPVVAFGKAISFCEHRLNRGDSRFLKGAFVAVSLVLGVYVITLLLLRLAALFSPGMLLTVQILLIFYCLAGTTLVREVRMVFKAVDRSLEEGRMQVARIVGRDTSALSAQEVRTAALETLAENLSDGVVAPLFWYLLLDGTGFRSPFLVCFCGQIWQPACQSQFRLSGSRPCRYSGLPFRRSAQLFRRGGMETLYRF